ncbi:hypothetical protein ANN_26841 [Periplaneta americana]|uniref:Uncharacterized protein n=1 Tax=Periplaneta americana TaxID=6978 RepID=A0ABQ8RZE8_PERAM|nr:hypothetical protein ANN_26841 [Periplaneta americana]
MSLDNSIFLHFRIGVLPTYQRSCLASTAFILKSAYRYVRCVCLSAIANSGSAALQHMVYADPPRSRRLEISKSNNKCAGKIGSVSSTTRLLNRLGFRYRKTNGGQKYLMERNDIVAVRLTFLRKMHMIRSSGDTRPTFYLDETCVCLSAIANSGSAALQHMVYADPPRSRRLEISKSNNKCAGKIGSVSSTTRLLNRLGFRYRKTNGGQKYLMEQNDIVAVRLTFLRKMHMIRSSGDTRPTFYLDETINRPPNTSSKKDEISEWVKSKGVSFSPSDTTDVNIAPSSSIPHMSAINPVSTLPGEWALTVYSTVINNRILLQSHRERQSMKKSVMNVTSLFDGDTLLDRLGSSNTINLAFSVVNQCRQELNQTYYNESVAVPNNCPWNTLTPAASLDPLGNVLDDVNYYAEHYGKIMKVIDALDSTDNSAVAAVKSLPSEQLLEDIMFIDSNFKIVPKSIILLESSKLHFSEALNKVDKVSQTVIQNNNSLISEKVKCKLRNIIAKNSAYSQLRILNDVLSGHDKISEVGVLKSSDFPFFKYVRITSCDAETTSEASKPDHAYQHNNACRLMGLTERSLPSKETLRGHSDSSFRGEGYIQCCVGVRLCDMYSNQELAEIHFMYGKADGNAALARRLYQEGYTQRQCPDRKTFVRLHYRLCEYGKFNSPGLGRERPRSTTPEVQEEILEAVNMTPSISTRRVALQVNVPHTTVWRLLKEYQLYLYHLQCVQALSPADYPARVRFCQWFLQQCGVNPNFPALVLFTDEAQFTRDGITNFHNQHVWAYENPRATVPSHHQVRFSLNMWAGIIGDRLVGPHVLVNRLTGQAYTNFLENTIPHVLEDTPLIIVNTFTSCMMALLHTSVVRLAGTWIEGFLIDG